MLCFKYASFPASGPCSWETQDCRQILCTVCRNASVLFTDKLLQSRNPGRVSAEKGVCSMSITAKRLLTGFFFILLISFCFFSASLAEPSPQFTLEDGEFLYSEARAILEYVNQLRTGGDAWYWNESDTEKVYTGKQEALIYSYELESLAMLRAAEIAFSYSHTRPDGSSVLDILPCPAGENIAQGQTSPQAAFTAWLEENEPYAGQGHRRNMLGSDYVTIGIGAYECNNRIYWTQVFSVSTYAGEDDHHLSVPVSFDISPEVIKSISFCADNGVFEIIHVGDTRNWRDLSVNVMTYDMPSYFKTPSVRGHFENADFVCSNPGILESKGNSFTALSAGSADIRITLGNKTFIVPLSVYSGETYNTGEFGLRLNGVMTTSMPVHVVADGPAGASYYNFYLRGSSSSVEYRGTYRYPSDFWIYPARIDFPSAYPTHVWLEVYAYSDSGSMLGMASTEFYLCSDSSCLVLPEGIRQIEAEAFAGIKAVHVDMQYEVTEIGPRAFADCPSLLSVRLSSALTSIAEDAFEGCRSNLLIEAVPGSAGAEFARKYGFPLLPVYE